MARTLESLRGIDRPDNVDVRVIVADNDTEPSAKTIIDAMDDFPFPVFYIHAPAQNISIARNACLDATDADYVAWIDDDEIVDPSWLKQIFHTLRNGGYDAVFGPAIAVYPPDAPDHIVSGDFHSNRPVRRQGEVQTGHTCNALVDMGKPTTRAKRFDVCKGRTGGEDTDYFHRLWKEGAHLGIDENAFVFEDVVPDRMRSGWLMLRSFGSGHVFGELSRRDAAFWTLPGLVVMALVKAVYCLICAILTIGFATLRLWWLRRSIMHFGVTAGL
ncbi:MAG: glycosyltransferase family 2 protein, partial [Pseudomonadota bacterium]